MLLRKAIHKTKIFFHKTLQNLKSFLFGGYQKLPKAHPLNPLYCNNSNMEQLDQFYQDFSQQWKSDNDKAVKTSKKSIKSGKLPMNEEDTCIEEQRAPKNKHELEKKIGKREDGYMLAQRMLMNELEMMDMNDDVDYVLDIEEVLHYYSRLTCPVYLDIVDKFFIDMSSEFFHRGDSAL
ncbi:hypothetical protein LOK49_LG04G02665 [Camellia lanceoleosa]|uniref:Uncharacterized protein n=1 Tax=Camellia lanceoleosa TaxID=1840588 RepID=A0ACC0I432_9ERIC|nr:hypothetical protein LOK49_LG04G02665 [Camellia lanceoleosa]